MRVCIFLPDKQAKKTEEMQEDADTDEIREFSMGGVTCRHSCRRNNDHTQRWRNLNNIANLLNVKGVVIKLKGIDKIKRL